jgi:hypothetical protein
MALMPYISFHFLSFGNFGAPKKVLFYLTRDFLGHTGTRHLILQSSEWTLWTVELPFPRLGHRRRSREFSLATLQVHAADAGVGPSLQVLVVAAW